MKKDKLKGPEHKVFEHVALELATVFYEIGRSQGLKSKHKNARSYARNNFEKFLPRAIEHCISMLDRQDIPDLMKAEIYSALIERNNDPDANAMTGNILPDIQIQKILDALPKQDKISGMIDTAVKSINPYLKVN